jgi:hypothetical protein
MSHRIFENSNGTYNGNAEFQYVNSAGMGIEVLDPQNLYVVAGRATGKTTQLIARRSIRVSKDMPGAYFAFVGDYYSNLLSNTVPSMIKGWNDFGLKEGVCLENADFSIAAYAVRVNNGRIELKEPV